MRVSRIESKPFYEMTYHTSGRNGRIRELTLPFLKGYFEGAPAGLSSLCVTGDLQGREKADTNRLVGELVAEELHSHVELGLLPAIDAILLAGDLYDYPDLHKLGGSGDVTTVYQRFAELFPQVVGVYGNHDEVDESLLPMNARVLDDVIVDICGVNLGCVSGIVGNPRRKHRREQADFVAVVENLLRQRVDLLLAHQGPTGTLDSEKGDDLLRESLLTGGRSIYAFGHCYWQHFLQNIDQHQLLNVDNRVVILVNER